MAESEHSRERDSVRWNYISDWDQLHKEFELVIQSHFSGRRNVRVLEAGCGTAWPLRLDSLALEITGIDIDQNALDIRERTAGDLSAAIQGDLTTIDLPSASFDIIYSSYVLEHVQGAESALTNFVRWLRPGGILILKIPDGESAFGFLTRITPFWFHVLYKRYVKRNPNAGKKGHDPFPVVYDSVISEKGITKFSRDAELIPVMLYRTEFYPARLGKTKYLLQLVSKIVAIASFGTLPSTHSGLAAVLSKPAIERTR